MQNQVDPEEFLIEGGIPKSLVFHSKVDIDHLICPICLNILWKPVACAQDRCFQSFCESCITRWVNSNLPQNVIQEQIYSGENPSPPDSPVNDPVQTFSPLSTERSYSSQGEEESLEEEWLYDRGKAPTCPKCKRTFKQTSIPIIHNLLDAIELCCIHEGCEIKPKYEQFQKHILVCEFRKLTCVGCQEVFVQNEIGTHQQQCEHVQIQCGQCQSSLKRKDLLHNHPKEQCIQKQFDKKDLEIAKLSEQIEQLKAKNLQLEVRLDRILKGEFESLNQFTFKTSFTPNYQFNNGIAKLVRNSFNFQKQKNDFLHFYINHKIKTQCIFGIQWKIKIQALQGNLLLGICSSLCHHSIDFIINRLGEIKKKEWNENKYKHLRKVNFTFGDGDVLLFQFMPIAQTLRIKNETKHLICRFQSDEIGEMGDSFYTFCSLECAGDCLQFMC